MQEIWVGTKAQTPSDLKPILRRLNKSEIWTADPTGLDAWYLKKKELNKEKIKRNETKRTRLVLKPRWQPRDIPGLIYPCISTHDAQAWNAGLCCIPCRQNSYLSLIRLTRSRKCYSFLSWRHRQTNGEFLPLARLYSKDCLVPSSSICQLAPG